MIRTTGFALALLSIGACSSSEPDSSGPDDDQTEAPFPSSSSTDLERTLDEVVAAGVAPGVSLSVKHPDYRVWSGAAGVANTETGQALAPAVRFRAGSIMKMLTATAVLQLVEQNKLSLTDTLTDLLPAEITTRIPDAQAITVRMLLNHTAGLPDFSTAEFDAAVASDPTHVWSFDELLDRALAQPMLFTPGTAHSYTNTGYILLGEIIAETTGKPWRQVVREGVFARAKLEHSSLPEEGNPLCDGCSRGYHPVGEAVVDLTEVDPSMAGAAGGDALITTPEDLVKLLGALAAGKMFDDPATLDLMRDFVDAPVPEEAQTGYGLGLQHFQVEDVELIGHLGGTAGFQGFVLQYPGTGMVVSGYVNRYGDLGGFIIPVLDAVARMQ